MNKYIGARVFEYRDDFLMGPKQAHDNGEWLNGFCFASNAAEDDLAQLASLVGSKSTLKRSDTFEEITIVEDAPALEFDLEDELARAFQTDESTQDRAFEQANVSTASSIQDELMAEMQTADAMNFQSASESVDAPIMEHPATIADQITQPQDTAAEAGIDPMLDFNEMIADELDKALAQEVAADPGLSQEQTKPPFPADDIESELSKLMGIAPAAVSERQADVTERAPPPEVQVNDPEALRSVPPVPPAPNEAIDPWQKALVVEELPLPQPTPAEPSAASPSTYTPIQMSEFEPDSFEPREPVSADTKAEEMEPLPRETEAGSEHIDTVLGGAAALAAAASNTSGARNWDANLEGNPNANTAAAMAENDTDLRLRLDELELGQDRDKRRAGRRAAMAIVAVALLGGTAALAWNFVGSDGGDTPTLLASTEPVKVKPKDAGGKVVPNQDQAVYNAAKVQGQDASKQARLTDKKERPISVGVTSGAQKTDARVARNQPDTTSGLAIKPRSVRTVVVRPDGTIVSSNAPTTAPIVLAPSSITNPLLSLPKQVETESVNAVSSLNASPVETTAVAAPNKVKVTKVTTAALRATETPIAAKETVADTVAAEPTPKIDAETAAPKAVVAPKKVETRPVKVAAVKPKPVVQPSNEVLPQIASPYAVQISSQRSAGAAKQSYATLTRRYGNILNGRGVDIRRVEVKGKTYYRVRIPAENRASANQICGQLKANGGDCYVTR